MRARRLADDFATRASAHDREASSPIENYAALRREGFYELNEVDRCVLEPGGGFAIKRKEPPPSELHYAEVIERLKAVDSKLERLAASRS